MTDNKPKLSSRPPFKSADDFISSAPTATAPATIAPSPREPQPAPPVRPSAADILPWERPDVREDVIKGYNVRLPQPYLLKLRYIAEHTPYSMHAFCQEVLFDAIDSKVREIRRQRG